MIFIIKYLFVFLTGSTLGWCLEVIYRRYFGGAKKWINPGFLSGPYLPIYGTGICMLYIISSISMVLPLRIVVYALLTTTIEYLTGTFFLKKYNVRLWDYSNMKFNIHGHISALYTFFWTLLSVMFYYVLYPYFYEKTEFLYEHLELSLLIGVFYGILLVDIINSFNVLNRLLSIRDLLDEKVATIHFENLKEDLKNHFNIFYNKVEEIGHKLTHTVESIREKKQKPSFFFPFKNKDHLKIAIREYINKIKT